MKTITILGLVAALSGWPASGAMARSLSDICQARAEKGSGYAGSGLNWQSGKARLSISGSAAVGISHSSGAGGGVVSGFAGRRGADQNRTRARQEYARIYDACIKAG